MMDERGYIFPWPSGAEVKPPSLEPPQIPTREDRQMVSQALRNDKSIPQLPLRHVERKTGPTTWEPCRMLDLEVGDTFRMFEGRGGPPIQAGAHFKVNAPPFIDKKTGVPSVDASAMRKPKIGRNQACPCGSGKKYKKCCQGRD